MEARLTIVNAPYAAACAVAADDVVRAARAQGLPAARILPTAASATRTLRRLADAGTPALGVETTTLQGWAQGRWRLYGDGRTPVSAAERHGAALVALDTTPTAVLRAALPGMAGCLEDVVRAASGSAAYEGATPDDPRLSPAQRELLAVCRTYEGLLAGQGLIEPGAALALLPDALGTAGWAHLVVETPAELTDAELALVVAAAAQKGVTVVAQLGENPAFEAARALVARLEQACRTAGIPVDRTSAAGSSPWASEEIAALADHLFDPPRANPVVPRGSVGFCLPAGRYAEPELVAQTLSGLVGQGIAPRAVAVACRQPLALADAVGSRLAETAGRAIACRAQGSVPVTATDVGRLISELSALVEAEQSCGDEAAPQLRGTAADIARNPLAGIPAQDALELDCAWRKNRTATPAAFLADIAAAAGRREPRSAVPDLPDRPGAGNAPLTTWAALATATGNPPRLPAEALCAPVLRAIDALRAHDVATAAEVLAESVASLDATEAVERRERAAAAAIARAARSFEVFSPAGYTVALERLLADLSVPVAWIGVPTNDVAAQREAKVLDGNPNAVEFCTLAQLQGRSFEAVVVCDLTALAYSVADRLDAQTAFLSALGCTTGPTNLQNLRRQLRGALEAAGLRIVFERCLRDPEAKDLRPSALFEEIVDCYRADPTDPADLDRATGLPKAGLLPCTTLGEERFSRLASPLTWMPASYAVPVRAVAPADAELLRRLGGADHLWSPAELELYLSCPLRWFYDRQVPSSTLDTTFGPRELGSFSRQVLQAFHEALAATGQPRVGGDGSSWEAMLDECFDKILASQDSSKTPLAAVTNLERKRLETVRRDIASCVARDALMPAGFAPKHHGWSFGDKEPLAYGGVRMRGSVHRIDVDERNRALIINYKGAFNAQQYSMPKPGKKQDPATFDWLPRHSQVLMYASALQRVQPQTVAVGAVYVSYNRNRARGFVDYAIGNLLSKDSYISEKNLVEPAVPGVGQGPDGFQGLLTLVEDEVSAAMDRLRDGDIAPRPRFGKNSCAYCTVNGCPKRRA